MTPHTKLCPTCDGLCRVWYPCDEPECNERYYHGHAHDCTTCGGTGEVAVTCEDCGVVIDESNHGYTEPPSYVVSLTWCAACNAKNCDASLERLSKQIGEENSNLCDKIYELTYAGCEK